MATHSSILAWKFPWTEEPGWLQSMGSQRIGHKWATEHTHSIPKIGDNVKKNPWLIGFKSQFHHLLAFLSWVQVSVLPFNSFLVIVLVSNSSYQTFFCHLKTRNDKSHRPLWVIPPLSGAIRKPFMQYVPFFPSSYLSKGKITKTVDCRRYRNKHEEANSFLRNWWCSIS